MTKKVLHATGVIGMVYVIVLCHVSITMHQEEKMMILPS